MPTRSLLVLIFCFIAPLAYAESKWTAEDLGKVTEAAMLAARDQSRVRASDLLNLANALIKSGTKIRAQEVLEAAAVSLTPNDYSNVRAEIAGKLAMLGVSAPARALVSSEKSPFTKMMLLGKFGAGRTQAGSLEEALEAARDIASLSASTAAPASVVSEASTRALAEISVAIGTKGHVREALQLLRDVSNSPAKVRALSQIATVSCTSKDGNSREALEQTTSSARLALEATNKEFEKVDIVALAGEAVAACSGADRAHQFVAEATGPNFEYRVLGVIADHLTERGEVALALSLLPKPGTTNVESLFVAAKRLLKLGERARAVAVARQAARLALQGVPSSERRPGWYHDYTGKLGQISATLIQLGAYDDAIAVIQPMDPSNRVQYYARALLAAAQEPNSPEVRRLFPVTMEAFRIKPMIHALHLRQLSDLAEALAVDGYRDFAIKAVQEFQDQLGKSPSADQVRQRISLSAVMQADSGDIDGAILAAENAGPMVGRPTDAQLAALAVMMAGGQTTPAKFEDIKRQAIERWPAAAGSKADVLSAIVVHLARKGNFSGALQAFDILDSEPDDAIKGIHDSAAEVLAREQEKQGDLRGAYTTALHIRQPIVRSPILVSLAGIAPRQ
ncbi:MAG: hypothetical protein ACTHM2_04905 [Afipia sp.]